MLRDSVSVLFTLGSHAIVHENNIQLRIVGSKMQETGSSYIDWQKVFDMQ